MTITIYHNPKCSTSRTVLGLIRAAGEEPTIVEYLKTPPDRATLGTLIRATGGRARALLRAKEPLCAELGLDDPGAGDAAIIAAMLAHPVLIERPIVVTPLGTRLCRPPEAVHAILPGSKDSRSAS